MNPFRPNAPRRQAAHNVAESDLIAFHLRDLPPDRAQAVQSALTADPALAAESLSIAATLSALKDIPMHIDDAVLDRNWKALRPSLTAYPLPFIPVPVRKQRWRLPVFAGAAAAFAATAIFFLMPRFSTLPASREAAHAGLFTPGPLALSGQSQTPAMEEGKAGSGASPFRRGDLTSRGSLNNGLFHPLPGRPGQLVHELSLARSAATPLAPGAGPRLTFDPEPPVPAGPSSLQPDRAELGPAAQPQLFTKSKPVSVKAHREHTVDVMLALGGNFIAPHTSVVAVTQRSSITATHAIAAVGAFHQQFRPVLGYRLTASYSRPDFNYTYGGTGEINSRIYEAAGTYVLQGPHRGRLSTSADVGAGLLVFLPTVSSLSTSYVYRAAGVLGVNVDYALTRHWGARLVYRAQVFKTPDFRYNGGTVPVSSSVTVSNEPSLGVTYNFGKN